MDKVYVLATLTDTYGLLVVPALFVATHLNVELTVMALAVISVKCSDPLINAVTVLSLVTIDPELFSHVTDGDGFPDALHCNCAACPDTATRSEGRIVNWGLTSGAEDNENN